MTKRLLDIIASVSALLFLAPVFALIWIFLKMEGQDGSLFYGGERIGYHNKKFKCWKIRSMQPDSDHLLYDYLDKNPQAKENWEKFRKLENDPRVIAKTARFIRKASLDELPQLWNVLLGDMSLVGPRPILEDEKHYFSTGAYAEYISVRPGLTGLWQVSGRNELSFEERIQLDREYIKNMSFWNDLMIIIKTPIVLLTGRGAS